MPMHGLGKRRSARKDVKIAATARDLASSCVINCIILDASKTGCRIKTEKLAELADEVWINIAGMKNPARGKIVWRHADMAGVQFAWDSQFGAERQDDSWQTDEPPAVVSDGQQQNNLEPVVQNISKSDCVAVAENIAGMLDEINIEMETEGEPGPGDIVRQNGNMPGVEFDQTAEADTADDAQQAAAILDEFMTSFRDAATDKDSGTQMAEMLVDDLSVAASETEDSPDETGNDDPVPRARSWTKSLFTKTFSR